MAISRQKIIDMLNHLGYSEAAEEASRVLPEQVDLKQVEEFGDRQGIARTELESRMGGSPLVASQPVLPACGPGSP